MSLTRLPTELLSLILDELGPEFFHEDPERLLVCKRWFSHAESIYLSHFSLSLLDFKSFIHFNKQIQRKGSSIANAVRSIKFQLYDHWLFFIPFRTLKFAPFAHLLERYETTRDDVLQLSSILQSYKMLKALRISDEGLTDEPDHKFDRECSFHVFNSLVHLTQLTSLELNLQRTPSTEAFDDWEEIHLCPLLQRLLGSLERLLLRIPSMCPAAFDSPIRGRRLPMKELLVNVSINTCMRRTLLSDYSTVSEMGKTGSRRCDRKFKRPDKLTPVIERQVASLVSQMHKPKTVRILSCAYPSMETVALDVLTQRRMALSEEADWNAEGKLLQEDDGSQSVDGD